MFKDTFIAYAEKIYKFLVANKRKVSFYLITIVGIVVFSIGVFAFQLNTIFEAVELSMFDYRTKIYVLLKGKEADSEISLLVHNDESSQILNQNIQYMPISKWPFPRSVWGDVLMYLRRAPVHLIVFDVKFAGQDNEIIVPKHVNVNSENPQDTILDYTDSEENNIQTSKNLEEKDSRENVTYLVDYFEQNYPSEKVDFRKLFTGYEAITNSHLSSYNDMVFLRELINNNSQPYNNTLLPIIMRNPLSLVYSGLTEQLYYEFSTRNLLQNPDYIKKTLKDINDPDSEVTLGTYMKHKELVDMMLIMLSTSKNQLKLMESDAKINTYLQRFYKVSLEDIEELKMYTFLESYYIFISTILYEYVQASSNIGTINVEKTDKITNVTRDYKTFFLYQPIMEIVKETEKQQYYLVQSMPLATARQSKENTEKIKFANRKFGFGNEMLLGDRRFSLNEKGNIFVNWRVNPRVKTTFTPSFTTVSLVKALLYEYFYTWEPDTGYKRLPEEEILYLIWNQPFYFYQDNQKIVDQHLIVLLREYEAFLSRCELKSTLMHNSQLVQNLFHNAYLFPYSYENRLKDFIYDESVQNNYYKKLDDHHLAYAYMNNTVKGIPVSYYYAWYDGATINKEFEKAKKVTEKITYHQKYYFNLLASPFDFEIINKQSAKNMYRQPLERFNSSIIQHPTIFLNNVVVVGECTATGDIHHVPVAKAYPGPEIVTTAIDNFMNDGGSDSKMLTVAPFWLNLLIVLFFIIFTYYSTITSSSYAGSITILFGILVLFVILNTFVFAFPSIRIWINMLYPLIFIVLTSIGTMAYKNMVIDADKKQLKSMFSKFVSPQILEDVMGNPDNVAAFKPKKKVMTVLFSDIRDFTTRSESSDPLNLIQQLNEYFAEMVEVIIMKYNGTLDKFMGDAIMAFWNAPVEMEDHAKNAVLTALAMKEHLKLLNQKWISEGRTPIRIGVGINTGEMIVGAIGSERLVDYTVIGDNVNTASRLEGLNKQYGTEIIISEYTYEYVKDIVEVEFLGTPALKGKTQEVKIYSVLRLKDNVDVNFDPKPLLYTHVLSDELIESIYSKDAEVIDGPAKDMTPNEKNNEPV
jgi:class 3 adenylate cyclase/CHASE2 domain-containing sensor protein